MEVVEGGNYLNSSSVYRHPTYSVSCVSGMPRLASDERLIESTPVIISLSCTYSYIN